jgi:hypothetical protein
MFKYYKLNIDHKIQLLCRYTRAGCIFQKN